MSSEVTSKPETQVPWGRAQSGSGGLIAGRGLRRRPTALEITEARGPITSLRRDAIFRRMLVLADVAAVVLAFAITLALIPSLGLTTASFVCLPLILLGAKLYGLYDRDEM